MTIVNSVNRAGSVRNLGLVLAAAKSMELPAAPRSASRSAQSVFDGMPDDFQASKAKGVKLTVRFHLTGSGGGDWFVTIENGTIKVSKGSGPKPDVTMNADADDYVKIANGEKNGTLAFMRGKVRIEGSVALMRKFESFFDYDR